MSFGLTILELEHGVAKATPGTVQLNLPKVSFCAGAKCMGSPYIRPPLGFLGGLGLRNVIRFNDLGALAWGSEGHPRPSSAKPTQTEFLWECEMHEQSIQLSSLENSWGAGFGKCLWV